MLAMHNALNHSTKQQSQIQQKKKQNKKSAKHLNGNLIISIKII